MNLNDNIQEMILDTMHGDLTRSFIEELQAAEDGWSKLSEAKQEQVINRCRDKSEDVIRKITLLINQRGFDTCTASIENVNFKGEIKAGLKVFNNAGGHQLANHVNQSVLIVFADPSEFLNGGEMPEAEPDQKDALQEAANG